MSFRETDVKELAGQDHEVLGTDFCSGYTDIFGKWNTGFDCPRVRSGESVYCCGTFTYKYCCTRRDQHTSSHGISQTVLLASALGSVLMVVIVSLLSCLICRRCPPYRRPHPSLNGGPLYAMHCSSTASGHLFSFAGSSNLTTPLDAPPHVLVDLDNPEHAYSIPVHRAINGRHLGLETPSDPPPPYNETEAPVAEEATQHRETPTHNSFDLPTSRVTLFSSQRNSCSQESSRPPGNECVAQNPLYWSTKF